MKRIILFLLFLIPWYGSTLLLQGNFSYYREIELPSFAPPQIVFPIIWGIVYIGIAITLYHIHHNFNLCQNKQYSKIVLFNYILNQFYPFLFFQFHNLFLSFICCVAINISTIIFYYETKDMNKKTALFLLPYLLWATFATILSIAVYLFNF